jgi:hypothetical protein
MLIRHLHFEEGLAACMSGAERKANPYPRWGSAWIAWLAGWDEAHAALGIPGNGRGVPAATAAFDFLPPDAAIAG